MQLVVPEALSFPCARLVKAMAALISFQYVSSLPFAFSFCVAPGPPLLLMSEPTMQHERTKQRALRSNANDSIWSAALRERLLTCHIYLIHALWFLKARRERERERKKKVNFAGFIGVNEDLLECR